MENYCYAFVVILITFSQEFVCDGYEQCGDGSDEGNEEVNVSDHP